MGKAKKTFKIAGRIVSGVIMALSIALLLNVIIAGFRGKTPTVFGYSLHVVVTDSMTPDINVHDLVVAKETSNSSIGPGDDIVFVSRDPLLKGKTVVHRVVSVNEKGEFVTCGIKDGRFSDPDYYDDYTVIEPIGKVVAVSAAWGKIFWTLGGGRNIIFLILMLVIVIIIIIEGIDIIKKFRSKGTAGTAGENKGSDDNPA